VMDMDECENTFFYVFLENQKNALSQTPKLDLKGPTSMGRRAREREGRGRERRKRERGKGGKDSGPPRSVNPGYGPAMALSRRWVPDRRQQQ